VLIRKKKAVFVPGKGSFCKLSGKKKTTRCVRPRGTEEEGGTAPRQGENIVLRKKPSPREKKKKRWNGNEKAERLWEKKSSGPREEKKKNCGVACKKKKSPTSARITEREKKSQSAAGGKQPFRGGKKRPEQNLAFRKQTKKGTGRSQKKKADFAR